MLIRLCNQGEENIHVLDKHHDACISSTSLRIFFFCGCINTDWLKQSLDEVARAKRKRYVSRFYINDEGGMALSKKIGRVVSETYGIRQWDRKNVQLGLEGCRMQCSHVMSAFMLLLYPHVFFLLFFGFLYIVSAK